MGKSRVTGPPINYPALTRKTGLKVLNIVLFEPEIPPNTGNIIRLAANSGAVLHLIKPLGFTLDDRRMRRAGLDYHEFSELCVHDHWSAFRETLGPNRLLGFSTQGRQHYASIAYQPGDFLLFGPETRGLPAEIRQLLAPERLLRIPMLPGSRSLNLSNAVAVVVYEAWRQLGFRNGI